MKVLIIDDEEIIRALLTDILHGLGMASTSVSNCKLGLDLLLSENDFNIVFIDWNTPLMNGIELVKQTKLAPHLNKLKLIMLTGRNELGDVTQALDAGVDEYIMKPFDAEIVELKLNLLGCTFLTSE